MLLRTHHTFFYKFHMVCTSQPPKIWWHTSVQACLILNCLKTIFLKDWDNFYYKPIPNNAEFTFKGKNILLFQKFSCWMSNSNLFLGFFSFISRHQPYRWDAVVSWLNYLIQALGLRGYTAQYQVKHAVDLVLIHPPWFTSRMLHPIVSNATRPYDYYITLFVTVWPYQLGQ